MHAVLFFAQVGGHWDERLDTEDTAGVLIILRQLSKDWDELLDNVLLLKLSGEVSELGGANTTNHRRVFLTELHELLSQLVLIVVSLGIGVVEERAGGDASSEPVTRGKTNDEWAEDVLHLFLAEVDADVLQRLGGLLTHDSLVRRGKSLKQV